MENLIVFMKNMPLTTKFSSYISPDKKSLIVIFQLDFFAF